MRQLIEDLISMMEYHVEQTRPIHSTTVALQAAREALKAMPAPVQEPVAWGVIASNTGRICQVELDADEVEGHNPKHIVPLYTTPPNVATPLAAKRQSAQRQWVGLTDEEIEQAWEESSPYYNENDFARAIEVKLKEKNSG
jgi:hypothetical protein